MSDEKPVNCGCGGEAKVWVNNPQCIVICQKCEISTKWHNTESEAIAAWNKAMSERTAKVYSVMRDIYHCGKCDEYVNEKYSYCPSCGAKLDWSGNE